jgi:hypothetical protein
MEFVADHGVEWRRKFIRLSHEAGLKLDFIDPTNKPGDENAKIGEDKGYQTRLKEAGRWRELKEYVEGYRRLDLRYVDLSDCIVAVVDPRVPQWGTGNEVYFAEMQHKPTFFICEGGLKNLPNWLFAVIDLDDPLEDKRCNVFGSVEEVIEECDEFNALSGYEGVIRLLWRKKCPERLGRVVAGTAQLFPKKERDLWNNPNRPAPWWDVTISIPAWLCMDKMERLRLVHHELSHLYIDVDKRGHPKPALMGHDVEENLNTLARFGVFGKQQANFVAIGQRHPSWTGAVREYDIDVNGQASLFPKAWGQK